MTFSLALPSWLLKLPFQFTTAPRKRNENSRKAMHLKYWPAAFKLRPNFNLDEITSRIRGQAPKRYPKWRRPMTNFLLLWRGISLGSDALWKPKQRSVTQLSVVFLLVSTKNIHFLELPSPLNWPKYSTEADQSLECVKKNGTPTNWYIQDYKCKQSHFVGFFCRNPQSLVRSVFSRETGRVLVVGAPDTPVVDATAIVEKLLCRFSSILQPSRVIYYKSHRRLTCDSSSNL